MAPRQMFVNLPVGDLDRAVSFFSKLGFEFDPQFTDDNATCMIVGENSFVMLLVEDFFQGFIPGKRICERDHAEVLVALSAESRDAVDGMIDGATAQGGKEYREAQDHGWMYQRAFEDLDGHVWEIAFMDPSQMPDEMQGDGGA